MTGWHLVPIHLGQQPYCTTDSVGRTAVLTYQSVWTARLRDYGFLSAVFHGLALIFMWATEPGSAARPASALAGAP